MTEQALVQHQADGILTVTFNRPHKLNALTFEMLRQLRAIVDEFRVDDDLRVLMITGNGKYYSAGMDIDAGLAPETPSGIEFRDWYRTSIHTLFDEMEAVEKPIVAAIQGPCLGGALEMALSCDFRLAAASAAFALPETKIGALPGSGGISRLTRLVGIAEAKWLVMGAQTISPDRALRVGLVHSIYPDAEFADAAHAFAAQLVALPKEVLAMAKLVIEAAHDVDRSTARNLERIANTPLSQSKDHRDLVNAFLNRKK